MAIRKREWTDATGNVKSAWIIEYKDGGGKRRLKTFARKKDAEAYGATVAVEVRQGIHTADGASVTVAEAAKDWLGAADRAGLERATCDQYRQHVDLHIKPFLGTAKLSQLSVPKVKSYEDSLLDSGRSEAMVRKIMASLSSIITDAIERGKVHRNVVKEMRARRRRGADRQAVARRKGKLKVGVDIPTPDEVRAILGAVQDPWRPLLFTAVFAGLRASELRGLRWENVDLDDGKIHVRERADRYNERGAPKSAAGERSVPIPPELLKTLKAWKLKSGGRNLVFGTGRGNVESLGNIINRGLKPVQIAAGVTVPAQGKDGAAVIAAKYTGMHALRHFYASWCINTRRAGGLELSPKVVQTRLGHASIQMTFDTYGHLFPGDDDGAAMRQAEKNLLGK